MGCGKTCKEILAYSGDFKDFNVLLEAVRFFLFFPQNHPAVQENATYDGLDIVQSNLHGIRRDWWVTWAVYRSEKWPFLVLTEKCSIFTETFFLIEFWSPEPPKFGKSPWHSEVAQLRWGQSGYAWALPSFSTYRICLFRFWKDFGFCFSLCDICNAE